MKKIAIVVAFLFASVALGENRVTPLTRAIADSLYAKLGGGSTITGTTTFTNVTVTGTCTGCGSGVSSSRLISTTSPLGGGGDLSADRTLTCTLCLTSGGALGTPSSGTLTNGTGLPISTGISGLASGIAAFLATASSANLASALSDKTGSGLSVFNSSPTIIGSPIIQNTSAPATTKWLNTASFGAGYIGSSGSSSSMLFQLSVNRNFTATPDDATRASAAINLNSQANDGNITLFTGTANDGTVVQALKLAKDQTATFAGVLLAPDGAVGAPSYSFTNSPTTGMYSQSANSVIIATNGVAAITVNNGQSVTLANAITIPATITLGTAASSNGDIAFRNATNGFLGHITFSSSTASRTINFDTTAMSATRNLKMANNNVDLGLLGNPVGTSMTLTTPTFAGHVVTSGNTPTLSSCGTSPSIVGNDSAGRVTIGTGVTTTCTLTFDATWTTAPVCHAENETTILLVQPVPTTTTLVLNSGSALTSNVIAYSCRGY